MSDLMHSEEYKGLTIKIHQDDSAESPRDWDNLGKLVCFHKRYLLGDSKHGFSTPNELQEYIKQSKAIALNVYMIDHGGISLSTSEFGCPWDSGQVGMIFVERDRVLK